MIPDPTTLPQALDYIRHLKRMIHTLQKQICPSVTHKQVIRFFTPETTYFPSRYKAMEDAHRDINRVLRHHVVDDIIRPNPDYDDCPFEERVVLIPYQPPQP